MPSYPDGTGVIVGDQHVRTRRGAPQSSSPRPPLKESRDAPRSFGQFPLGFSSYPNQITQERPFRSMNILMAETRDVRCCVQTTVPWEVHPYLVTTYPWELRWESLPVDRVWTHFSWEAYSTSSGHVCARSTPSTGYTHRRSFSGSGSFPSLRPKSAAGGQTHLCCETHLLRMARSSWLSCQLCAPFATGSKECW